LNTSANKSIGQYSYELQQKPDDKINPIELQREIHKGTNSERSYEEEVIVALERGKKEFDGDLFVIVLLQKFRVLKNAGRSFFFPRKSCPTPEYDQTVYQYFRKEDRLKFLWIVPNKQTVIDMCLIGNTLPPDQQELVQFARDFSSGALDRISAILNNEVY